MDRALRIRCLGRAYGLRVPRFQAHGGTARAYRVHGPRNFFQDRRTVYPAVHHTDLGGLMFHSRPIQVLLLLPCGVTLFDGCVHSGVVKVGPDTYMVAISDWAVTSGGYEKAKAIGEGSKYCASIGREILVIDTTQNDMSFGRQAAAEVRFRCLLKGDPELTRPPAGKDQQTPK
jgi:hypothetical protein